MRQPLTITPDLLRAALAFVPAALPRDEWARVGMAIKSEYPDGVGFDLFDAWSAGRRRPADMLATVYDDVPKEAWPLAERQILAHLERLRRLGRIAD